MLDVSLLGGASRGKTRPRGFVDWKPQASSLALLEQIQTVLDEYQEYLPLTCRQIFYRLVGAHGFEKTERSYARLCELINRARRARLVSMEVIRDDGGRRIEPNTWTDAKEFLDTVRRQAARVRLDRQEGQPNRLAIMCEATGMAPQLATAVEDYSLPVISSGGFESVTEKYRFAADLTQYRYSAQRIEILHVGDHDPSGAHLFLALAEDVKAFAEAFDVRVTFTRLAVTPDQIESLSLPTAPPKATDNRAFHGETCQAEAIPPDELAEIVIRAVEDRFDRRAYGAVLEREAAVRLELGARLA